MPIIASAKKQLRQSLKKATRNQALKSRMKSQVKTALAKKDPESIRLAVKTIDKAAKHQLIHKNKAGRLKSKVMSAPAKKTS